MVKPCANYVSLLKRLPIMASNPRFTKDRVFTREAVEALLNAAKGKTLGEVDKCGIINEAYKERNDSGSWNCWGCY